MKLKVIFSIIAVLSLSSCSLLMNPNHNKQVVASSLMDFLYPKEKKGIEHKPHKPEIPILKLPVNIGLAFVPTTHWSNNELHYKDQIELLEKVKKSFVKYDYIDRIEVIPNTYLKKQGGFDSLEQVARMYDVDVMALVSYDQVAQLYENNAALFYWTIVGMYLIPGNENSIQTFVDTSVFDVASKKMLFRAPGINKIEKRSTAIGINEVVSEKSLESFHLAVEDMTVNLETELGRFKERVKTEKVAKVEYRSGYSGGGSAHWLVAFLFLLLGLRKIDV